ncbi:MAG: AAA family ATPase [Candidatus Melainabacteria bacterium]|nr:AAA family ATPase [Candidatus Melainabacteria bacterium]
MDRRIYFQIPDPAERKQIFQYYLDKVSCDAELDIDHMVGLTQGYSPADIYQIVNEAALVSTRPGGPNKVTTEVMEQALDRISVGLERIMVDSGIEIPNPDPTVRLDHVIGIDQEKQDVAEIIDFLKQGADLRAIGAKVPRGIILVGPPGVGKTLLAKAIANEAGVPFYGISASYFKSAFEGAGATRLRALYRQARKSPSAIVFIDEIDALGGSQGAHGETLRTSELNEILVQLDGFSRSNVITIGATNNEQVLDPAFYRAGRFDRKVYIGLPDADARKKMFDLYMRKVQSEGTFDMDRLAKESINFTGADISACVNEAAILAVRNGRKKIIQDDLREAIKKTSATAGHKLNTSGMNFNRVPDVDVKLDSIKGMEEAKGEASEVVALLKAAELVEDMGLKAPRGLLLVGKPGTGKTMLAKAIANEAGVPFYYASGAEFVQVWVGLGPQRVRALYEQARRSGKPAIVFIDEIDALASKRVADIGAGGQNERNNTLNQLLAEMDGFGKHKVLTIGATNNVDMLDPAVLRPGRFDRMIDVPLPDLEGRVGILEHYAKNFKVDPKVNLLDLARITVFSSPATLAKIVNEAGLMAIRDGRTEIKQVDLFSAFERVAAGMAFNRNVIIKELWETAYHEAGHAMVAYYRHKRSRVQVVSVVPRGHTLGITWFPDKDDYHSRNREEMLSEIEVALGSYVAEKLYMDTTTQGVYGDLQGAGQIARTMVKDLGMGKFKFSIEAAYGERISSETAREVDLEIKAIIDSCLANVEQLLLAKRKELDEFAKALVENETLYFKDIVKILEPHRNEESVDKEIKELAERKKVGKAPRFSLDVIDGLKEVSQHVKKNGSNGNGSNGSSHHESGHTEIQTDVLDTTSEKKPDSGT